MLDVLLLLLLISLFGKFSLEQTELDEEGVGDMVVIVDDEEVEFVALLVLVVAVLLLLLLLLEFSKFWLAPVAALDEEGDEACVLAPLLLVAPPLPPNFDWLTLRDA